MLEKLSVKIKLPDLNPNLDLRKLNLSICLNPVFTKPLLVKLYFGFALLPYISPIPLGSDVQFVTGLIAHFTIFLLLLRDKFLLDFRDLTLLMLSIFFIFYINLDEPTYQFRKAIGPLYSFGVYYIAKRHSNHFNIRILDIVLLVYLIGALTQFISPGLFNATFENFLREAKYSTSTGRGVTSLSPEPSFLGIIAIYILVIQDLFYTESKLDQKYFVRVAVAVLLIVMSKSGAGYILLFLYASTKFLPIIRKYWYVSLFALIIFFTAIHNIDSVSGNKGLSDLVGVLKSTSPRALLHVSSFSNRFNPIMVGTLGFIDRPMGRGSGSFTTQAKEVYLAYNLEEIYPPHIRGRLFYEISSDSVSTFGKYLFEYGVFFVLYLVVITIGLDRKKLDIFRAFLIYIGLLFSLPIVYPPLWILFGLFDKKGVGLSRK